MSHCSSAGAAGSLLKSGRIGPNPADDGGVADRDPTVPQHEFRTAVADPEHQTPWDRPQDRLIGELPLF
jgi:hypothetical protein